MDPNACLKEIRELVKAIWREESIDLDHLATLVEGLDRWIAKGGFLPTAWQSHT